MANWRDKKPSGRDRARARQQASQEREQTSQPASGGKADWRKKGSSAAARREQAKPDWAKTDAKPADWRVYRIKIILFALGALIVGGFVVFMISIFRQPKSTPIIVVEQRQGNGTREYSSNPNQSGAGSAFERSKTANEGLKPKPTEGMDLLTSENVEELLRKLDVFGGGPAKDICMIHVAGIGVVGRDGKPYLVSLGADAFDQSNWIPLEASLQRLNGVKDKRGNPLRFVVMIDSAPMVPMISPELMVDSFPSSMRTLFTEPGPLADSNVHVLLSHDTGQRSWFAPNLGKSVFTYFLAKGFAGDADGFLSGGGEDSSITLKELSEYVRAHVDLWVTKNRGVRQTPVLLPSDANLDADFGILFTGDYNKLDLAESTTETVRQRASEIDARWENLASRLDEMKTLFRLSDSVSLRDYLNRIRPVEFSRFENQMSRLASMVADAPSTEFDELLKEADRLMDDMFDFGNLEDNSRVLSLAEEVYRGGLPTEKLTASYPDGDLDGDWLARWIQAHDLPDVEKRNEAVDAMRLNMTYQDEQYITREEIRWLMWNWMLSFGDAGPSQEQLAEAVSVVNEHDSNNRSSAIEWVEIKFLRLLNDFVDWEAGSTAEISAAIAAALACRAESEQFYVSVDYRSLVWLEDRVAPIEQQRREAEDLVFVGRFGEAATALRDLAPQYAGFSEQSARIADVLDLHEEALRKTSQLIAWSFRQHAVNLARLYQEDGELSADGKRELAQFKGDALRLRGLIESADKLGQNLYTAVDFDAFDVNGEIQKMSAKLRSDLDDEMERFEEANRKLINDRAGASPEALIALYNALLCPLVGDSGQRQSLTDQFIRTLETSLGDESSGRIDAVPELAWQDNLVADYQEVVNSVISPEDQSDFIMAESQLRSQFDELVGALSRASWDMSDRTSMYDLMDDLEQDWLASEDPLNRAQQRERIFGVDYFLRRTAPFLAASTSEIRLPDGEAPRATGEELMLIHRDLRQMVMARRAMNDFWGNGLQNDGRSSGGRNSSFYFANLAKEYLRSVTSSESMRRGLVEDINTLSELATQFNTRGYNWLSPKDDATYVLGQGREFSHQCEIDIAEGVPAGFLRAYLGRTINDDAVYPVLSVSNQQIRNFEIESTGGQPISKTLIYKVPVADFGQREEFAVHLSFRGHQTSRNFEAYQPTVAIERDRKSTQITPVDIRESNVEVRGGEKATSDIAIIVDFSNSMSALVEDPDNPAQSVARYAIARRLAQKLMSRLRDEGTYRVCVFAYGHRSRWVGRDVEWNTEYNTEVEIDRLIEEGFHPYNDVELIFELDSSDYRATSGSQFANMISFFEKQKLVNWGNTPLYESIKKAGEHLATNGNPEAKKQIVVITDGVDNPGLKDINGEVAEFGDLVNTERDELQPLLKNIAIHMVLYGLTTSNETEAEKKEQLLKIQELSGVLDEVVDTSDSSEVMDRIDDFIVPNVFTLSPSSGPDPNKETNLDSTWTAIIEQRGLHTLSMRDQGVDDQKLYLYGGENLTIEITDEKTIKIDQVPVAQFSKSEEYVFGGVDTDIGLIEVEGQFTFERFILGFRDSRGDALHTDRPGYVMLDVAESSPASGELFDYRLYDYEYRPGTSFPVLEFPPLQDYDPAIVYDVVIKAVPMGKRPRRVLIDQRIDQIADIDQPFSTTEEGVEIEIYKNVVRGNTSVVVTLKSDDAAKVKELMAVTTLPGTVNRNFHPDWLDATYTFTFSPEALTESGDEPVRLQIFKQSELFSAQNEVITHRFQFP